MARTRGTGRRTDYSWGQTGDILIAIDIAADAVYGAVGFNFLEAGTLTRIRGRIGATLNTGGVGEQGLFLCGLTIVHNDSFTAGVAPELFTGSVDEASWIWRGSLFLSAGDEAAVVTEKLSGDIEIDTKAMRRVKPNDLLAMVFEAPLEEWVDGGGTINAFYDLHILFGS